MTSRTRDALKAQINTLIGSVTADREISPTDVATCLDDIVDSAWNLLDGVTEAFTSGTISSGDVTSSGDVSAVTTTASSTASGSPVQGTRYQTTQGATLTISSGEITVTNGYHQIDTEGAAASDTLATINDPGWPVPTALVLRTVSDSRDVTISNGTGNITTATGEDIVLDAASAPVLLLKGSPTSWHAIGLTESSLGYYLPLAGGTMSGDIAMGGNDVNGLGMVAFGTAPATQGELRSDGTVTWYTRTTSGVNQTILAYYPDSTGDFAVGPSVNDPSAGNLYLRTRNGIIYLQVGGVNRWVVDSDGDLLPQAQYDIGSLGVRAGDIYCQDIDASGGTFTAVVSGVTPTASAHLATKGYVDGLIVTDHGALSGLGDDDHGQYLRTDGSRALTGNWSAGGYAITSINYLSIGTSNVSSTGDVRFDSAPAIYARTPDNTGDWQFIGASGTTGNLFIGSSTTPSGGTQGRVYIRSGGNQYFSVGGSDRVAVTSTGMAPTSSSYILGDTSNRWGVIYAVDHNYTGNRVTPWTSANVTSTSYTLPAVSSEAVRLSGTVSEAQVHNITAGSDGQHLVLALDSSASFGVTVRDNIGTGTSNIRLKASDVALDAAWKKLCLIYDSDASAWCEV